MEGAPPLNVYDVTPPLALDSNFLVASDTKSSALYASGLLTEMDCVLPETLALSN